MNGWCSLRRRLCCLTGDMSRSFATAFQSLNKLLTKETYTTVNLCNACGKLINMQTLGLYRSLLRSTKDFDQRAFLLNTIRERFRFHQYETSRPRVLKLLTEGGKVLS